MSERNVKSILILRFSSLGDIVMATPMVRCVRKRFPAARIDMVVREDFLDLIRHNPHLDGKIGLPRGSGRRGLADLIRHLNSQNYDLVYDAHRSLRTLFLMPQLRCVEKAYFQKQYVRRDLALTFKLPLLKKAPRMIERYLFPLAPWGVEFDGRGPELFIHADDEASMRRKVSLPSGAGLLVGLIPSAQWPGKRWPLHYFRELLVQLVKQTPHRFIIFGGPADDFCQTLVGGLPEDRICNTQGKLTILESAAALRSCAFTVANDTGLMHVADALGRPSVLILGPTSKELGCLPFHAETAVLEHELWCRPCSKNGQAPCIRHRRVCLERTKPQDVVDAVYRLSRRGEGACR